MRFLVDAMYGPKVASLLRDAGHDAVHVAESGMQAATDEDLLTLATAQKRTVVTENASDFLLLDARIAAGIEVTPVVIVLTSSLPRGAGPMSRALADDLGVSELAED